jgi:hypothetical protein
MEKQMNTTITRGEAMDTIDFAIEQFINDMHVKQGTIDLITYAVNNDLQIRDYFLGLPYEFNLPTCVDFVGYLASKTNDSECYAYDTISAMYHIEQGNVELAESLLEIAEKNSPDYNLMKLAKRIISAGWDGKTLEKMREDLHLTVIETIKETYKLEIEKVA